MRARIALYVALGLAPFALACEGVPDLRFASAEDGAASSSPTPVLDATIGDDGSSGDVTPDATILDSAVPPGVDATGPLLPQDAATPPPASDGAPPPATGCPSHPPTGFICCSAVACKGTQQQCDCNLCAYCASEGFCCPSAHPPSPGTCASSASGCQ